MPKVAIFSSPTKPVAAARSTSYLRQALFLILSTCGKIRDTPVFFMGLIVCAANPFRQARHRSIRSQRRFSDPGQRIDDIRAVMDTAGSNRAVLLGMSEGGAMVQLFAATYPERVSGLVLIGLTRMQKPRSRLTKDPKLAEAQILASWGTGASLPDFAPGLAHDLEFRDWWARFERLSASPWAVIKLRQMNSEIDVTPILPSIQAPTLIIHRVDDVRCSVKTARDMAAAIGNARMVELPGKDHLVWLEESGIVLAEIRKFVDTAPEPVEPDRVLTTVLFTDIVDSTKRAAAVGDTEWRSVMDAHFSLARSLLRRFRGREVKTLGDGIL